MTKNEFLIKLCTRLNRLHPDDIEESVSYYSEMIDDRVEGGEKEEDVISSLGSINSIADQIIREMPIASLVKSRIKPKKTLKAWEIVLICLGSPIWISLLISLFAVVFSVYAILWSLVVSLYAITVSFLASILCGIFGIIAFAIANEAIKGLIVLSFGFILFGIGLILLKPCICVTVGMVRLSKGILVLIKRCIIGKGDSQ